VLAVVQDSGDIWAGGHMCRWELSPFLALITLDLIKFRHWGLEISRPDIYVTKSEDNSAIGYSNPSTVAIIMFCAVFSSNVLFWFVICFDTL